MTPITRILRAGFSLLEIMIVVLVMFVLASIGVAMMHKTSEASLQAHCMGNLRTLLQAVNNYQLDYRTYPVQYPGPAFPTIFSSYSFNSSTYTCLVYDEIGGNPNDVYSPFYIRPQDDMIELLSLSCPYHEENKKTITISNRGRTEVTLSSQVIYIDQEVEPLGDFEGNTINLADGSLVRLQASLNAEQIASYKIRNRVYYSLRILQGEAGVMDVELRGGTSVLLVCEAGVAFMDAESGATNFRVTLTIPSGVPTGTISVLAGPGKISTYGDTLSAI